MINLILAELDDKIQEEIIAYLEKICVDCLTKKDYANSQTLLKLLKYLTEDPQLKSTIEESALLRGVEERSIDIEIQGKDIIFNPPEEITLEYQAFPSLEKLEERIDRHCFERLRNKVKSDLTLRQSIYQAAILNQVVIETLAKWSPGISLEVCQTFKREFYSLKKVNSYKGGFILDELVAGVESTLKVVNLYPKNTYCLLENRELKELIARELSILSPLYTTKCDDMWKLIKGHNRWHYLYYRSMTYLEAVEIVIKIGRGTYKWHPAYIEYATLPPKVEVPPEEKPELTEVLPSAQQPSIHSQQRDSLIRRKVV